MLLIPDLKPFSECIVMAIIRVLDDLFELTHMGKDFKTWK